MGRPVALSASRITGNRTSGRVWLSKQLSYLPPKNAKDDRSWCEWACWSDFEFEKAMLAFGKLRCALEVVDFPASILLSVFGLVA
eukprot:1195888-Prorocentrum_minimum.AAC.4